ncbi:hypothetical protein H5410_048277 [Solanum commersonii]|uniref:Uncharacterized protein n=1 Tax=Solanum commersonii TaxID=4109 RepID=A0A9J5XHP9_SOLCO|nr:hypothetical protein H5410_048277 [Solanum commersonii]
MTLQTREVLRGAANAQNKSRTDTRSVVKEQKELTTSEKATEREPISMEKAALYLLSTKVAIKNHENAPRSPESTKYDLLRYPKSGKESLYRKSSCHEIFHQLARWIRMKNKAESNLMKPYNGFTSHGNDEKPDMTAV